MTICSQSIVPFSPSSPSDSWVNIEPSANQIAFTPFGSLHQSIYKEWKAHLKYNQQWNCHLATAHEIGRTERGYRQDLTLEQNHHMIGCGREHRELLYDFNISETKILFKSIRRYPNAATSVSMLPYPRATTTKTYQWATGKYRWRERHAGNFQV